MSPKDKRQLAHEHLEAARQAVNEERLNDAINALFYASEAAVVALATRHDIDTRQRHALKANAAGTLYEKGITDENFRSLLLKLNQARKDIWCAAHTRWAQRISADREQAVRNQTPEQRAITAEVKRRAVDAGAVGFALTGSTARRRRTPISDLDYHVIGDRPDVSDLSAEIDVVATRPEHLRDRLLNGDDFVQWTVRLGCILYDVGPLCEASRLIASHNLWPDPQRKLDLAERLHAETRRLLRIGDREAAQEQLRAMLTTTARGLLLRAGVFPLARDELASQLDGCGYASLARALSSTIYETPTLELLSRHLQTGVDSLQTSKSPAAA